MLVSWSATIPFLMAYAVMAATIFVEFLSPLVGLAIACVLLLVGVVLIQLGGNRFAIMPFLYGLKNDPGSAYTVIRYKTWWGTSKSNHLVWRKAVRLIPGVYRLVGNNISIESSELTRRSDTFHTFEDYDDERNGGK